MMAVHVTTLETLAMNLGATLAIELDDLPEPNTPAADVLADRLGIPIERASELLLRYADDLDSLMKHVAAIA